MYPDIYTHIARSDLELLGHYSIIREHMEERPVSPTTKAQAEAFKDRGNAAFKDGKFREAVCEPVFPLPLDRTAAGVRRSCVWWV